MKSHLLTEHKIVGTAKELEKYREMLESKLVEEQRSSGQ